MWLSKKEMQGPAPTYLAEFLHSINNLLEQTNRQVLERGVVAS